MLVPGGIEGAGGIGRWAGYLSESWTLQGLQPSLELADTRSVGGAGRAVLAFLRALLHILRLNGAGQLGSVHANLSKRGSTVRKVLVSALAARMRVPLVLHLHGSGYDGFYAALPAFWRRRVAAMFHRADHVLVLGQFWADWVIDTLRVAPAKVSVLHNGVPVPMPVPVPAAADRVAGPCRILLLGRLGPRKGVPELLSALGSAAMRDRAWTATLAGDGEVEQYRHRVHAAGLADRVALPGWLGVRETGTLLAQADILVLPSHAENFPMSVIEALAAGVAVVTTPVGATPELLAHGHSALFVPVGDAAALAEVLVRLIDDPALRRRIGEAGRAVFADRLNIEALARRLAALHLSLHRTARC